MNKRCAYVSLCTPADKPWTVIVIDTHAAENVSGVTMVHLAGAVVPRQQKLVIILSAVLAYHLTQY
jgi:hypothetical protein